MAISSKTLAQDKYRSSGERTLPFKSRKKMAEAMAEVGVAVAERACASSSRRWTRQGGRGTRVMGTARWPERAGCHGGLYHVDGRFSEPSRDRVEQ